MKYLAVLLSFLTLSCATQKRCIEKFGKSDTVKISTVIYKDTIIPVYIASVDTVYSYGTIHDTVIVSSGTAHGQSWVVRDTLKLLVWQSDTTLKVKIDSAIKVIAEKETIIRTMKEKYIPKWIKELAVFGGLIFLMLIAFFLFKVIRFFQID